jgi:hypothetical protein
VFNSINADDEGASSDSKYLSYSLLMHFSGTLVTIMVDHETVDNYLPEYLHMEMELA